MIPPKSASHRDALDQQPAERNEWRIQEDLTRRWRESGLRHQGRHFELVCWELMFPSWQINVNTGKWNEPSIDFVLFDGDQSFLCLELKNRINTRRDLLSAFCQVTHRASLFAESYSIEKIAGAFHACRNSSSPERGGVSKTNKARVFPRSITVDRAIMATSFPRDMSEHLAAWNSMNLSELRAAAASYATTREFERLLTIPEHTLTSTLTTSVTAIVES